MFKRWQNKYKLARLQRQISRKIEEHTHHLKMSSITENDFDLLIHARDELLQELNLTPEERKKFGLRS